MTRQLQKGIKVSELLKVRLILSVLLLPVLLFVLSACNGATRVLNVAGPCSSLVHESLWLPVEGATIPDPTVAAVGDWQTFGNEQTNNLDDANAKPPAIRQIITQCEQRDERIIREINKPWYKFW